MKIEELQVGQTVDIQYITYTNNGGLRWLRNLKVQEITSDSICFVQMGKTLRVFWIGMSDIKALYKVNKRNK